MRESLSHHALRGVMWSAVERFSVQGIQFVSVLDRVSLEGGLESNILYTFVALVVCEML